jgi:tetratricopeptide (TPR) repeat protein
LERKFLAMRSRFLARAIIFFFALALLLCVSPTYAQTSSDTGTDEDDAVQLFQQGQDAHETGDFKRAIELYDRAIKARPEFPEAEFQRASALQSLNRLPEAEKGFRRAIELQPDWSLPYTSLGKLLASLEQFDEAEKVLGHAIELDDKNVMAFVALADVDLRMKAPREKLQPLLEGLKRSTDDNPANVAVWTARGLVELALDNKTAAGASFDHVLMLDNRNVEALVRRAELRAATGNYAPALADAIEANQIELSRPTHSALRTSLLLARIYVQAGKPDDALKVLDALDEKSKAAPEVVAFRSSFQKDCSTSTAEERAATEELLKRDPRNASLLSCLGAALRTIDPARSLELYRQAAEIEPQNIRYAVGYSAALVQARRFEEAVVILRRILGVQPDNFTAHANLATALYELKQFPAALAEYKWLLEAKPDLVVAYYFIATAHDFLGEYADALAAYETFLARADAQTNQLEIDKVNLRLPVLRNQVKRGEGKKKGKSE